MKKDLILLLSNDCCKGRKCNECPFFDLDFKCNLIDIINIIQKENDKNEK